MKKLVIIPAYNEEKNIAKVVNDIKENLRDFDYIVVNDGSTDNTLCVCIENGFNFISLPVNLGIGGAMQTGYRYAFRNNYDYAIQIDGDGQHNSSDVRKLLNLIEEEKVNLVIGSRFIKKEGFQSTALRRLGINYFSKLINILTGAIVTDPTSGFRICDKTVIKYFASCYPKDYPEPESIIMILKEGLKILEVDTEMKERNEGISSINKIKSVYYMVKVSLAIFISSCKESRKFNNSI